MELNQLKAFIEIAECQSISKAADNLFVSQPALSVSIQKLEAELGHYLFNRNSQGMTLTELGQNIYENAKKILEEINTIYTVAEEENNKIVIRIAANSAIFYYLLPIVEDLFNQRFPNTLLLLEEIPMTYITKDISIFNYNFIIATPSSAGELSGVSKKKTMTSQFLYSDMPIACLNVTHPLTKKEFLSDEDLQNYPLILQRNELKSRNDLTNNNISILFSKENVKRNLSNSDTAIAILPSCFLYEDIYIDAGLLTIKQLENTPESIPYHIYYDKTRILSQPEKYFLELMITEGNRLSNLLEEFRKSM